MSNIITWKENKKTHQVELRALEQFELFDDEIADKVRIFMDCECGVTNLFHNYNFDIEKNYCHSCNRKLEEIPLWEF